MPQTSPERAARWPGMDSEAIDFLQSRGYRLQRNWSWLMPEGKTLPDEREEDAILYLIEEWDFDGWVRPNSGDPRETQSDRACRNRRYCSACGRYVCTGGYCTGCGLGVEKCDHGASG